MTIDITALRKKILILYVEDYPRTLESWLKFIRKHCNPQSAGVRSRKGALKQIKDWEKAGLAPDVIILDRSILENEHDVKDSVSAGDALYTHLSDEEMSIAIFSAEHESLHTQEPFIDDPPLLGFYPKSDMERDLLSVVDTYIREHQGG